MNFEELTTLMAQNRSSSEFTSRLSPFSSDPNDLNPLTPGAFLDEHAISSFPEPRPYCFGFFFVLSFQVETRSISERQILEPLEHRISDPSARPRAKWSRQNPNLMENQLVLKRIPTPSPWTGLWGRILEKYFPVVMVL
ncbi:hypothetical protein TNCV_3178371 [Trichonephila clavipes]|nr:hypothetical protein TNCV_3178371 [Trichonephila clavipes]